MTPTITACIAAGAFAFGFATPIAAWRYSTTCYDCTVHKDVELMDDGSAMTGNGVWDGHLADPVERFLFYVRHPKAPRPQGKGDLWLNTQREKWTTPIVFHCPSSGGPCRTEMPKNALEQ